MCPPHSSSMDSIPHPSRRLWHPGPRRLRCLKLGPPTFHSKTRNKRHCRLSAATSLLLLKCCYTVHRPHERRAVPATHTHCSSQQLPGATLCSPAGARPTSLLFSLRWVFAVSGWDELLQASIRHRQPWLENFGHMTSCVRYWLNV